MAFKKLNTKISLAIVSCSVIATLAVGGIALFSSANNIKEESAEKLAYKAETVNLTLSHQMKEVENSTAQLSKLSAELIHSADLDSAVALKELEAITLAYMASTKGALSGYIMFDASLTEKPVTAWVKAEGSGYSVISDAEQTREDYITEYESLIADAGKWTDVYTDEILDKQMISYTLPLTLDGKVIGLVGFDIGLDYFITTIADIKLYTSGYAYLLKEDGTLLYHPELKAGDNLAQVEEGALAPLLSKIQTEKVGHYDYQFKGASKFASYIQMPNGWYIVLAPKYDEMFANLNEVIQVVFILIGVSVVICLTVGILLSRDITKPVIRLKESLKRASAGDLTATVEVKGQDEIAEASIQFNEMARQMRNLVGQINESCFTVDHATQVIGQISTTSASVFSEIATSMESISEASSDQAKGAELLLNASVKLGKEIDQVDMSSAEMTEIAKTANHVGERGLETVAALVKSTEEKHIQSQAIDKAVTDNHRSAQEIATILDTVIGIANQTNLLALNASIEAARAGEHGRGFTVVAEEVKKLAEASTASVEEVKQYIDAIQRQSAHAVEVLKGIQKIEHQQSSLVNETSLSFKQIIEAISALVQSVETLSGSASEMRHHKDDSLRLIERSSSGAEEMAASTQEVSSSTEEGSASLEEMSDLVQSLMQLIQSLKQTVSVFKV